MKRNRVLTRQEKNADKIRQRSVDDLENLFKDVMLVLSSNDAASDKVSQPQRVLRREIGDAVSILEPLLPKVVMLVICHSTLALQNAKC